MTDDLISEPTELDYHDELVGDGKKFKDEQALAKGKFLADKYIATLEAKLDQLREDYRTLREDNIAKDSLRELIDQTKAQRTQKNDNTTVEYEKPSIDPRQMESLIDARISEREAARKQTENLKMLKSKLEASYGKDYQEKLQEKITELDMSFNELNNMARTNPKTLMKLLDLDKSVDAPQRDVFRAPPRSSQTTATFKPMQEQRTWDWYQKLKVSDPKKYYSPETNVQMHKDALSLGEAFEDGDFGAYAKDYRISY